MNRQVILKNYPIGIGLKSLAFAGVVRKFPAEVVIQRPMRQPGEEVPGQYCEVLAAGEIRKCLANVGRRCLKEARPDPAAVPKGFPTRPP